MPGTEAGPPALAPVLDRALGGSARIVVARGVAGIGKTRLLDATASALRARSRVLTVHCGELGDASDFGVARALFRPVRAVVENDRSRDDVACRALAGLYSSKGFAGSATLGEAYPALQGLYWLAASLLAERPLTLVVDDAELCDEPSMWWLDFLLRRADRLPLLVLLARRTGRAGPGAAGLGGLAADPRCTVIDLSPLTPSQVHEILRESLPAGPDSVFTAACAQASGGNPRALWRLIGRLREEGVTPDAAGASRVAELSGEVVGPMIVARLDGQPEHVLEVARAAAILGTRNLDLVPVLSGVPPRVVDSAVWVLRELELVSGATADLGNDILRSAVLGRLTPQERVRRRARAARLLNEAGRPHDDVAEQLVHVPGRTERWMVGVLRGAAELELGRGHAEVALRYLRHALDGDDGTSRLPLLLDSVGPLGRIDPPAALRVVRSVLPEIRDPLHRARIGITAGRLAVRAGRAAETVPLLAGTLEQLRASLPSEPDDAQRELLTSAEATLLLTSVVEESTVDTAARRARAVAHPAGHTEAERSLLAGLAVVALQQGAPAEEAAAAARAALAGGDSGAAGFTELCAGGVLLAADDVDGAQEALTRLVDHSRRADPWMYLQGLTARALLRSRAGDLARAAVDADTALRFRQDAPRLHSFVDLVRALVLLERGEVDEAEAALGRFDEKPASRFLLASAVFLDVRGRIRLARGDLRGALACFEEGLNLSGRSTGNLTEPLRWRPAMVETLTALGDHDRAGELAEQELVSADRWRTPRARGVALRAAGIAAGGARGRELLAEAAGILTASPARLELARTEFVLARSLLAADDKEGARKYARRALNLGTACGATALAREAKSLLKSAGGRARSIPDTVLSGIRTEILTATECRVAELAVRGRRNNEIAETLFVSPRTVEFHLRNIYRKLDVVDRKDLAARLRPVSSVENSAH
ncbi:LuxR C-terminal-related transcriptional regulator [Amycolatopsis sp. NPDC059021]|uniref:LuxR C-terminal-related transcriptional regulator n=1 Tax=Amycolatopsis sp. NPDC059021 TaxID=3346704 RepID=UPI00366E075D